MGTFAAVRYSVRYSFRYSNIQNPKIPALTNRTVSFEPVDQITSNKDLTHPILLGYESK